VRLEVVLKTVIFEAGPIGMQLEPTLEDKGCRVYGFVDGDTGDPSQARTSGKIKMGDVIISVNGAFPDSYEGTIELLKAAGPREIVFLDGSDDDLRRQSSYTEGEAARRSGVRTTEKKGRIKGDQERRVKEKRNQKEARESEQDSEETKAWGERKEGQDKEEVKR
jgi:hypothetical protein